MLLDVCNLNQTIKKVRLLKAIVKAKMSELFPIT